MPEGTGKRRKLARRPRARPPTACQKPCPGAFASQRCPKCDPPSTEGLSQPAFFRRRCLPALKQ
eukprot:378018-Alexandrium_andersonii.AAC.1